MKLYYLSEEKTLSKEDYDSMVEGCMYQDKADAIDGMDEGDTTYKYLHEVELNGVAVYEMTKTLKKVK